jgi:hypothetical protein
MTDKCNNLLGERVAGMNSWVLSLLMMPFGVGQVAASVSQSCATGKMQCMQGWYEVRGYEWHRTEDREDGGRENNVPGMHERHMMPADRGGDVKQDEVYL